MEVGREGERLREEERRGEERRGEERKRRKRHWEPDLLCMVQKCRKEQLDVRKVE